MTGVTTMHPAAGVWKQLGRADTAASVPPSARSVSLAAITKGGDLTPSLCGVVDTTVTFTTVTGDVTLSTAGQVYENKIVNGKVSVTAANVTIRNCYLNGPQSGTTNTACVVATNAGCVNLTVQDCTINPSVPTLWINGINGANFTARSNDFSNVVDSIGQYNTNAWNSGANPNYASNVTVDANYVHDLLYFTPDPNHTSDNQTHNDSLIQLQGGNGSVITRNRVIARYGTAGSSSPSVGGATPSGASNPSLSGVLFNQNVGNSTGHTITDNYFDGGYLLFNCGGGTAGNLGNILRNEFSGSHGWAGHTIDPTTAQVAAGTTIPVTGADRNYYSDGSAITLHNG